ncbi:MAG TPA: flavodoxin domain-containing protein [Candidatus Brocadiia bacterium]|nr:flavodoxin domain-containing protein [Candidatus Brocadiia bacterium]
MTAEIAKNVHWVGVADWALRKFHGHELSTHRGTTYNAYLILDEKKALVDTVWTPFQDQLIENIRAVINPAELDYVVANHSEIDHAGGLDAVLRYAPKATVVVSKRGMSSVKGHFHKDWNFKSVVTGDRIRLGRNELVFVEAPMLHWPDSMFTYLTGLNVLMPNDAFGQHYATSARFNDHVDQTALYEEALKYYANILTPFSALVAKKIEEILALGLPVDMIAPSHGVIWRDNPLQIVEKYRDWAAQTPQKSTVIIYDTMWEGTRRMAEAIGDGLAAKGVPYRIFHAATSDRNDVITEVFKAKAVLLGSPTFNKGLLPTLWPILADLKGLSFKNKTGAAFGTYGWSGESLAILEKHLQDCGIPIAAPGVRAMWQPGGEDLQKCARLGEQVAETILGG